MLNFESESSGILTALKEKGFVVCSTKGCSMNPFLHHLKENILVEKLQEKVKKYDICLYIRKDGSYVLHRVSRVKDGYYLFVGDNHILREKVDKNQIIGILKGYYKGEKFIDCNSFSFKIKSRLWCFLPFKIIGVGFNRLIALLKRIIRKIFK